MDKNKKIILFGAGNYGKKALDFFGENRVEYFIDNDVRKQGKFIHGKKVLFFDEYVKIHYQYNTIISIYDYLAADVSKQLDDMRIEDYYFYQEFAYDFKNIFDVNLLADINYDEIKNKALQWIRNNTVEEKGIINNTDLKLPYPEVAGYYIPTLIKYNEMDLAKQYTNWLVDIQDNDGYWRDTREKDAYVFDTAQVLKGLIAIYDYVPMVKQSIIKASDWLISCMDKDGKFHTPTTAQWEISSKCSDIIHIYCISPLYDVAQICGDDKYKIAADKAKYYYTHVRKEEILSFDLLSHFQAYVLEALYDLEEMELLEIATNNLLSYEKENRFIPAYKNVNWICSTALFQLSYVWYKMGKTEIADKNFDYGCRLQNRSGGWYGSYGKKAENLRPNDIENYPSYLPNSEISWAIKFFLDALYAK